MGHRKPFHFQGGRRYLILTPLQPGKPHGLIVQISAGHKSSEALQEQGEYYDFQGEKSLGKSHQNFRSQLEMAKPQHSHSCWAP